MRFVATESFGELVEMIAALVGSAVLTVAGTITEQAALQNVLTGHIVLGAWEAWMGTLALVVGLYLLGFQEGLPRLRKFLHV